MGAAFNVVTSVFSLVGKALKHAGYKAQREVRLVWVEASNLEPSAKTTDPAKYHQAWENIKAAHGIVLYLKWGVVPASTQ